MDYFYQATTDKSITNKEVLDLLKKVRKTLNLEENELIVEERKWKLEKGSYKTSRAIGYRSKEEYKYDYTIYSQPSSTLLMCQQINLGSSGATSVIAYLLGTLYKRK
jgi:hypothetical protein